MSIEKMKEIGKVLKKFSNWWIKKKRKFQKLQKNPYNDEDFSFKQKKEDKIIKHLNEGVDYQIL